MKIILSELLESDYPTLTEVNEVVIEDAYNRLMEYYKSREIWERNVIVNFSKPTIIRLNRYNTKVVISYKMKFFMSSNEQYCYTTMKRYGWNLEEFMEYKNIESLEIIDISEKEKIFINGHCTNKEKEKQIRSLLKCKHENLWSSLDESALRNHSNLNKKQFPKQLKYLKDILKRAFDNQEVYNHSEWAQKQKYTITCDFRKNGEYYAMLHSKGTNYKSYIILNPTTMINY